MSDRRLVYLMETPVQAPAGTEVQELWWAVLRTGYFIDMMGLDFELTEAHLETLVATYNPAVIHAPVKLHHWDGGDASGWIKALKVEGGMLWAQVELVSEDLREAIRQRKRRYVSSEFTFKHNLTNQPQFLGLAVLGAERPAVTELPEIHASEPPAGSPSYVYLTARPAPPMEIQPMPDPVTPATPAAPGGGAPASPAAATPAAPLTTAPTAPVASAEVLALAERHTALEAQLAAAETRQRQSDARQRAAVLLSEGGELHGRVNLAQRSLVTDLLVSLLSAPTPAVVQLSAPAQGQPATVPAADLLIQILAAAPSAADFGVDGRRTAINEGPRATPEAVAVAQAHGLSEERIFELQKKYPTVH